MAEINLLNRYPQSKKNIQAREATKDENRAIAMRFGQEYFDGTREQGYGGYRYDGRWLPVAETFRDHWKLKAGDRVLDVGCAKGFLVKDLMTVCPGLEAFGVDISQYAIDNALPEVKNRLRVANAAKLPFDDKSFDAVISINSIHNLELEQCLRAVQEIQRVSKGKSYIQVDSYRDAGERELFMKWMLTAKTHFYAEGWKDLFAKAGYTGDYYWTFV